jgi:hypothetical protein
MVMAFSIEMEALLREEMRQRTEANYFGCSFSAAELMQ